MNKFFRVLLVRLLALQMAFYPLLPGIARGALALPAIVYALTSDLAEAAARFGFCTTTCTWDNTSTAMWCATNTGCSGASAPVAGDDVTFSSTACVGGTTCTITTFAGTIAAKTITYGACTASTTGCIIAANTNNTNFTLDDAGGGVAGLLNGSGTGTRKWVGGTGTYNLTTTSASPWVEQSTTTNDTGSTFSGATFNLLGSQTGSRDFNGGGFSYGPTTIGANSSGGQSFLGGANTFASMAITGPFNLQLGNSTTNTITGALTLTGSSNSNAVFIASNSATPATLSLGAASTGTWMALKSITTSGAAALIGSNCFNLGRVTLANSGQCNTPAGGGGSRGIIGG